MMKGIAKSEGDGSHEDRYGVVVALSQLSKTLSDAGKDTAFFAAAETAATLLHVSKVVIFTKQGNEFKVGGSVGINSSDTLLDAALEVAMTAIAASAPVLYRNVKSQNSITAKKLAEKNIASVVCVPLRIGESVLGAVVAMSDDVRTFSPADIELLHVVASETALAAWQAVPSHAEDAKLIEGHDDLIRLAQRKIKELSLVNQVSGAVNSTLDLEKLLDIALEESMAAVGANVGSLMLINEETQRLEIVASRGIPEKWVEATSLSIGSSISGWVAEHGESVLVTDARNDSRFKMSSFRDNITSAASVPLKVKGQIIGVLNVNTTAPDQYFDERDLELLGTVANQMAVAIENARLYARVNRRTKQLGSLLQISKTITSTLNLDEVMHRLAHEICKLFHLDVCTLLLADELSGRLRLGHGHGLKTRKKYAYFDLAIPIATRAVKTNQRIVLRDINASSKLRTEISKAEKLHAAICIPLKNQGKLVGVVAGFAREKKAFRQSQLDIMRSLSELAGVAIHNARVYRKKYKIAQLLQNHLTPSNIPKVNGLDIGHKFLPAREVGGDYYDFIKFSDEKIGVVLGDVSGSDVEAAEFTTMGKHVLRTYARIHSSPS